MKRWKAILGVMIILFSFTGCFNLDDGSGDPMITASDFLGKMVTALFGPYQNEAADWMDQLLDAIQQHNQTAVSRLFSEDVVHSGDFDGQLARLLSLFNGDITSTEYTMGMTQSITDGGGYQTSEIGCDIAVNEKSYRIFLKVCMLNEQNGQNVGIVSLLVVTADQIDPQNSYWGWFEWIPGISIID